MRLVDADELKQTIYWRYNARLGCLSEMTEKEFNRKIKSRWVLPVWDSYWQTFSDNTYYDCRDSIANIFYIRQCERREDGTD